MASKYRNRGCHGVWTRPTRSAGSVSIQLVVILVPVLFALMGFALDLGRLYLVRGELNQAANAMALAAASQLLGTPASTDNATTAANQSLDDSQNLANKYNFGSLIIGQGSGNLGSTVNPPAFFATVADATAAPGASNQADGSKARHVQVSISADAPLLFWSLLPGGESRKSTVAAQAVAGISAPLCVACGIEPIAIAPLDPSDTVNFGFGDPAAGGVFTFAFSCTTTPGPTALAGPVVPYVLVNRFDTANATLDETQQAYRLGANGLIPSTNPNPTGSSVPIGCFGINDAEQLWPGVIPAACNPVLPPSQIVDMLCGFYSRIYNNNVPDVCLNGVADFGDITTPVQQDTDNTTLSSDPYSTYTGNGRRIITIPIVDAIASSAASTMTILGFRQFLLEPDNFTPADGNGRFAALYIGSPAPVKQGWIDDHFSLGCPAPVPSGPGKVVLHQ